VVAFSGALAEWLEAGRIDVAVLYDVRRRRRCWSTRCSWNICISSRRPRVNPRATADLAELATGSFVLASPENGMRKIVDKAAAG